MMDYYNRLVAAEFRARQDDSPIKIYSVGETTTCVLTLTGEREQSSFINVNIEGVIAAYINRAEQYQLVSTKRLMKPSKETPPYYLITVWDHSLSLVSSMQEKIFTQ